MKKNMVLEVSWTIDLEYTVTPIKNFILRKENNFCPTASLHLPSPTVEDSHGF